jgi:uncharacterized membrane protein required for colicin V production
MPWVDIILILFIAVAAFIGYSVGLLGALKGFISNILGLIIAWLATPFVQAWLETKWRVESILMSLIGDRLPAPLHELIRGVAQTARTLQELRENLMSAPLQPEVSLYLQRMMNKAPADTIPTPDMAVNMLTREIAQCVLWAFLFIFIWLITSILIKGFISMIFISKDGKTLIGVFDGVLGMVAMTIIIVTLLIVFSGLIFPLILMSGSGGNLAKIYPYLMDSKMIGWLAGIYQLYVIPWMG